VRKKRALASGRAVLVAATWQRGKRAAKLEGWQALRDACGQANNGRLASRSQVMPSRSVSLTPEQDAFIDEVLEQGEYRNASEAAGDAIRSLQKQRALDALKLDRLRVSIKAGIAALDRGDYSEVEDADLGEYLDGIVLPTTS
jgi:antitoxin ParD1/3/4